jgi:hypothetical protein
VDVIWHKKFDQLNRMNGSEQQKLQQKLQQKVTAKVTAYLCTFCLALTSVLIVI